MNQKIKVNGFIFVTFLAITYPILPNYFVFGKFMIRDLIAIICLLISNVFFLQNKMKFNKYTRTYIKVIIIWIGITALIQCYHSDYIFAFKQILLWLLIIPISIIGINSKKKFLFIVDVLIITACVIGIFGIIEELTNFNIFSLLNNAGYELNYNPARFGMTRIISFTSHAITYCSYCMMITALIVYRISLTNSKKRFFYFVCYFIVGINALFTLSRSAIICLFFCQLILLWLSGFKYFIKKMIKFIILIISIVGLLCIFNENIRKIVLLAYYTIMVIFNDDYTSYLLTAGLVDNTQGVGDRFSLYKWVFSDVRDNLIFGKGRMIDFHHAFRRNGYLIIKESIEVEWLRTLWRYGLVGMFTEVYYYIVLLFLTTKKNFKKPKSWEEKLSFVQCFLAILISYIFLLFAVMQNEEGQLMYIVSALFLSYIANKGFE